MSHQHRSRQEPSGSALVSPGVSGTSEIADFGSNAQNAEEVTPEQARARVSALLEAYLTLSVDVPAEDEDQEPVAVTFQAPYWTNRVEVERSDLAAAELDRQPVGMGRGMPDEITAVVASAVERGEIDGQGGWAPSIEGWMVKNGVGLDCVGFVINAYAELGLPLDSRGPGFGTRTGFGTATFPNTFNGPDTLIDISNIAPMDVMFLENADVPEDEQWNPVRGEGEALRKVDPTYSHHVAIVMDVLTPRDGFEVVFVIAESAESHGTQRGDHELAWDGSGLQQWVPEAQAWDAYPGRPFFHRPAEHGLMS